MRRSKSLWKQGAVPNHLEINDYIVQKIMNKELRAGQKIPSLHQLAKQFHVNPYIVRQAITRLENLGWVTSVQGKGSFVNERPKMVSAALTKVHRYTSTMLRMGEQPNAHLLDWCLDEPTGHEREALHISEHDQVYRLEILRFIGQTPLSLSTSTLLQNVFPQLERYLANFRSLYGLLEEHYNIVPLRNSSIIRTCMPLAKDANMLEMPENIPIFWKQNISVDAAGLPITMDISRNRGDIVEYVIDFENVAIAPTQTKTTSARSDAEGPNTIM